MLEIGTHVKIIGPQDCQRTVRAIWWDKEMNKFIGHEYVIDNIIEPYLQEEGYDDVVYTLTGVSSELGPWWFVREWLIPIDDIADEVDEDIDLDITMLFDM